MKLHPRVHGVQKAHLELAQATSNIIAKYALTYAELFSILNQIQGAWIKYAIWAERHPFEPDKPGGLE